MGSGLPHGVQLHDDVRRALYRMVDEVVAKGAPPGVERLVVEGHPAPVLVPSAMGDLLVVGSRGTGDSSDSRTER